MFAVFLIVTAWANSNITSTNYISRCEDPYFEAKQCMAGSNTSLCSSAVSRCASGCAIESDLVYSEKVQARSHVTECNGWSGRITPAAVGDKSLCQAAITEVASCKAACRPQYDSCVTTCRENVVDTVERTEAFRRCDANFRGKPLTVAKKAEPVDPRNDDKKDDPKEEEQTPTDPTDTPPQNNNTGDTNTIAQMPAFDGIGNTPYSDTSLSNDASAIDFSNGPTADAGGYKKAGAGVVNTSDSQGYVGMGHGNYNNELPSGELKGFTEGGNNGGGGNGGGGGGGGSPPMSSAMAAGGNNGGNPNAAKRSGGGGNYRNGAADYLSRHSPFSFQSGGNSNAPGNNAKRAVATNPKKNFGPRYNKKENDGTDALHRLFGNGQTPASYRRNPYAGSGACKDTVFCNMETFYNKIERMPNHDINPDSY